MLTGDHISYRHDWGSLTKKIPWAIFAKENYQEGFQAAFCLLFQFLFPRSFERFPLSRKKRWENIWCSTWTQTTLIATAAANVFPCARDDKQSDIYKFIALYCLQCGKHPVVSIAVYPLRRWHTWCSHGTKKDFEVHEFCIFDFLLGEKKHFTFFCWQKIEGSLKAKYKREKSNSSSKNCQFCFFLPVCAAHLFCRGRGHKESLATLGLPSFLGLKRNFFVATQAAFRGRSLEPVHCCTTNILFHSGGNIKQYPGPLRKCLRNKKMAHPLFSFKISFFLLRNRPFSFPPLKKHHPGESSVASLIFSFFLRGRPDSPWHLDFFSRVWCVYNTTNVWDGRTTPTRPPFLCYGLRRPFWELFGARFSVSMATTTTTPFHFPYILRLQK